MSLYHRRFRENTRPQYTVMARLNRFTTGGIPADAKGATMAERISRGYFGYSYLRIEAQITFFFRSKIINLSFNGLAYNMGEHFAHHFYRRNQDVQ